MLSTRINLLDKIRCNVENPHIADADRSPMETVHASAPPYRRPPPELSEHHFIYQKSTRFSTPEMLRPPASASAAKLTPWTVHDGKFFAATFAEEQPQPRAPQERRLQQRGLRRSRANREDRKKLRDMGISPAALERYSLRSAELLRVGAKSAEGEQAPSDLKGLGGNIVQLSSFEFNGDLMGSLLGVGSFSSVHCATHTADVRVTRAHWARQIGLID